MVAVGLVGIGPGDAESLDVVAARQGLPRKATGLLPAVLDSTGLKVYDEGEKKVRQHGWSKCRPWPLCELNLAVDAEAGEIEAALLTVAGVYDAEVAPALLPPVERPVANTSADGVYDCDNVYTQLAAQVPPAMIAIPPRRDATCGRHHRSCQAAPHPRDANLRYTLRGKHGHAKWKRDWNYHRRSSTDTAIYHPKTVFGHGLSARRLGPKLPKSGFAVARSTC